MNLLLAMDHRFDRTPDGAVWSWFFDRAFWRRYLEVFDEVQVLARVRDVSKAASIARRSDGDRVSFIPVPFYWGPIQYLRRFFEVRSVVRSAVHPETAVIMRSGQIANCLAKALKTDGHPYGLEIIGDFYDVFAPGANTHPLRPFLRWWYPRQVRKLCKGAAGVAYVTAEALQKRYPSAPGVFATHYSSIELAPEALAATPRMAPGDVRHLLAVGTMDQPYKGHEILLRALAESVHRGRVWSLAIVGDGRVRPVLEQRVRELGLENRVSFLGQLPAGQPVRDCLDRSDLFVLPSLTEGLPRALIEAMARGLPCIATSVGGTPELLPPEDRVPPGDASALALKLEEVATDIPRLNAMSLRNLQKAREYSADILQKRRARFYQYLKGVTQEWQAGRHPPAGRAHV